MFSVTYNERKFKRLFNEGNGNCFWLSICRMIGIVYDVVAGEETEVWEEVKKRVLQAVLAMPVSDRVSWGAKAIMEEQQSGESDDDFKVREVDYDGSIGDCSDDERWAALVNKSFADKGAWANASLFLHVTVAFPKMRLVIHTPQVSHVFSGADYDENADDNCCVYVEQVYSEASGEPIHFQELVDDPDENDNTCSTTDEENNDATSEKRMSMRTRQESAATQQPR